ncbi:flavin reductase family protein, partial [Gordonibacter pamelaeae]|nr:flavin reductase family protein [Gordonibacter pamelaeae]
MTIGWGTLGIDWSSPVFVAYVREHRFTRELLDKNPEFTVNVPFGEYSKKILGICGSKCGRNLDKISEAGLT